MLEYNRIDISEEIDINKTNASKEYIICHDQYFENIRFDIREDIHIGCHDLKQKAISFNDVTIVYVKGSAYRIHFWYMRKNDAIAIMNNSNLTEEMAVLQFFLLYIENE